MKVITTNEELHTLPVGSVVRSDEREYGEPIYVRQEEFWYAGWGWEGPVLPLLPVTVLHDPSGPVIPVVSDATVPSATREEVARVFYEQYLVTNMDDGLILADDLLARFTITPRTDR